MSSIPGPTNPVMNSTLDNSPKDTDPKELNIPLIAGCAGGGALVIIIVVIIVVLVKRRRRKQREAAEKQKETHQEEVAQKENQEPMHKSQEDNHSNAHEPKDEEKILFEEDNALHKKNTKDSAHNDMDNSNNLSSNRALLPNNSGKMRSTELLASQDQSSVTKNTYVNTPIIIDQYNTSNKILDIREEIKKISEENTMNNPISTMFKQKLSKAICLSEGTLDKRSIPDEEYYKKKPEVYLQELKDLQLARKELENGDRDMEKKITSAFDKKNSISDDNILSSIKDDKMIDNNDHDEYD